MLNQTKRNEYPSEKWLEERKGIMLNQTNPVKSSGQGGTNTLS
jgi:hypothetical protein